MILFLHLMIIQLNHRLIILYNNFLDQLSTFLQTIHRHHYRLLNFHLRNHQLSCYSYYCLIMKYYYPKIIFSKDIQSAGNFRITLYEFIEGKPLSEILFDDRISKREKKCYVKASASLHAPQPRHCNSCI